MFPEANHRPAILSEPRIRIGIPEAVCLNLLSPEFCVPLRPRSMLRTAVPEAPFHQNSDPSARKGDVRYAPWSLQDLQLYSVAQSIVVNLSPKRHFGVSAALTHLRHAVTGLR